MYGIIPRVSIEFSRVRKRQQVTAHFKTAISNDHRVYIAGTPYEPQDSESPIAQYVISALLRRREVAQISTRSTCIIVTLRGNWNLHHLKETVIAAVRRAGVKPQVA